jgi:hypothetical protein
MQQLHYHFSLPEYTLHSHLISVGSISLAETIHQVCSHQFNRSISHRIVQFSLDTMSKSECEAVAMYQRYFCDHYLYKHPYEWNAKKNRLVQVTSPRREVFLRQFHIPFLTSSFAILAIIFTLKYDQWFPKSLEMSDLAKAFLYAAFVFITGQMLAYIILIKYLDEISLAYNRILTFNSEISKFKVNSILTEYLLIINH